MSHIINPTKEEGGQSETRVSDDNVQELLDEILKEIKILNLHMAMITDNYYTKEDID